MAGTILGRDQVAKINQLYPELVSHLSSLIAQDNTAYGLMKVHVAVETLDTTELSRIFMQLPFISPAEKRALVRAAVYEVLVSRPELARAFQQPTITVTATAPRVLETRTDVFTPKRFNLNVNTIESHVHDEQPKVEEAAPARPTALNVVDNLKAEAAVLNAARDEKRQAAVEKIRAESAPTPLDEQSGN